MKRILGIDYGERRIGVAISDALCITAQPLKTITRDSDETAAEEICNIVRERDAERIVVGLPRNMDGSLGPQAKRVMEFASLLREKSGLPVETIDERLTTMRAQREMRNAGLSHAKKRKRVDTMSAQFILQTYLNQHAKR